MSRSEHATRRDPRDPGDLRRKRRIKELVAAERVHPGDAPIAQVPVSARARGTDVHYPASIDDVRAVLARVPVAAGIAAIELCIDEAEVERMTGIRCGEVLGRYYWDGPRVHVYGFTYDPAHPLRAIFEAVLRLQMLATLVHELGHHHDRVTRVGRGRWRGDARDDGEIYAEAMEYAWTRDHVLPYLDETYPDDHARLAAWLAHHAGLPIPLEMLAGDPRTTAGGGGVDLFFTVGGAFESLVADVVAGQPPAETRVDMAWQLHYGTHDDVALEVLARVLAVVPDHRRALLTRAHIYVDHGRIAEAQAIADAVAGDDEESHRLCGGLARVRGDWHGVLAHAAGDARLAVRARIELGDLDGAAQTLTALRAAATTPYARRRLDVLESVLLLRQGRHAEALALAGADRATDAAAVRLEAAHALGQPVDRDAILDVLPNLRWMGYLAWAARLDALA